MAGDLAEADLARLAAAGTARCPPRSRGWRCSTRRCAADRAVLPPVRLDLAALRGRTGDVPPLLRGLVRAAGPPGRGGDGRPAARWPRLAGLADDERDRALLDLVRGEVAAVLGYAGDRSRTAHARSPSSASTR